MGTWNTKINGNDIFLDIYQNFFTLYNQGRDPVDISKQIQIDFAEMFNDDDDKNNSLFGLALAQWETKSLDSAIFGQVKEIIENGYDIRIWEGMGANEKVLRKRQIVLEKFLSQLSSERDKAKRRVRPKFEYSAIELLNLPSPDLQKTFTIIESYQNGVYSSTSSGLSWSTGGGSVFYFYERGKFVTAKWVDSHILEIRHDPWIKFEKKDEKFYYSGDQGVINYIPEL